MPGGRAVVVMRGEGSEIQGAVAEVAAVAAASEEQAADAVRAAVAAVRYEVLPNFVDDYRLGQAPATKPGESEWVGDAAGELARSAVKLRRRYGLPRVAHNCLEAHGHICEWRDADHLATWSSSQAVSAAATQFGEGMGIPASNVEVHTDYMGGGFGSKVNIDSWGIVCAKLAKKAGAPVRLMLERDAELSVAGDRPSAYADVV